MARITITIHCKHYIEYGSGNDKNYYRIGQDDTLEFSTGRFLLISRDSAIFLSGWSLALWIIWTLNGMDAASVAECCSRKWSPIGVPSDTFRTSRICSLNRRRMGRFVSPIYMLSLPCCWQSLHCRQYTTFFCVQSLVNPDAHVWHLGPPGHLGFDSDELINLFLSFWGFFQANLIFKPDFLTLLSSVWYFTVSRKRSLLSLI